MGFLTEKVKKKTRVRYKTYAKNNERNSWKIENKSRRFSEKFSHRK